MPLGMKDGTIQDSQITASSFNDDGHDHGPHRARLDLQREGNKRGAWSAGSNDVNQWIQVDLRAITSVSGIVTQGRSDSNQRVTAYKVQYGNNVTSLQYIDSDETVRTNFVKQVSRQF